MKDSGYPGANQPETEQVQDAEYMRRAYLVAVESVTRDAIRISPAVISEVGVKEAAKSIVKQLREAGLLRC